LAAALADGGQTWVIGGAEIYHLALPLATRCEVTEVQIDLRPDDDDALAPVLDATWTGTAGGWQDSTSGLRYRFSTYLRPRPA
jgi:dihydrofolate reductase